MWMCERCGEIAESEVTVDEDADTGEETYWHIHSDGARYKAWMREDRDE